MAKCLYSFAVVIVAACVTFAANPAVAHETKAGSLTISDMWSRATVSTSRPAVGYLTVTNDGAEADRLVGVESPLAGKVQLHLSSMKDGVMKMEHMGGIEIPAGATVELAPGGYHLMLMQPRQVFKEGEMLPITLIFEKAGRVDIEAHVRAIGTTNGDGNGHH